MVWTVALLVDRERATHQRFCFGDAVYLKKARQNPQANGHVRMVWTVALLVDCERAAYQWLRFTKAVRRHQKGAQIAEVPGNIRMIAISSFVNSQRPAH